MEEKIYKLIKHCYEDALNGEIYGLNYQLFMMSLRSMIPFEDKIGCKFDENRYSDELKTLKYYINGEDKLVLSRIKQNSATSIYDYLLEYKIIPIILSNSIWENIINEVLRCVVFYTYSKESILEAIVVSSVLHEYIENNCTDKEYLHRITKQRIIDFSIKDFFIDNFDTSAKNSYNISFERERISYIIQADMFGREPLLDKRIISYILNCDRESSEFSQDNVDVSESNNNSLQSFSSYLYKLRKGMIDPRKLRYTASDKLDLRLYVKQESFTHPILGKCLVIKRNGNETIVKTKTGNIKVRV